VNEKKRKNYPEKEGILRVPVEHKSVNANSDIDYLCWGLGYRNL
jgi:hypothetical protein